MSRFWSATFEQLFAFGAIFSAEETLSNFFLFEQLFTTLLVAKNGMTLASLRLCSLFG
jgi:hypothetical protein